MKCELKRKIICSKSRLYLKCPSCSTMIILDEEIFLEDPHEINCIKCKTDYWISKFGASKTKSLMVELTKANTK